MHPSKNTAFLAGESHGLQGPPHSAQARQEIAWIRVSIIGLRAKYERRPRTLRQIRDLERQLRERGGVPDRLPWYPPADDAI